MPLAILCCLVNVAPADQFEDFTYTDNGTTITITAYTGAGGAVDIPASIVIDTVSKPVTDIGDAAFSGHTSLTSVTIPDSVTSIGVGAFQSCSLLTGVYFKGNAPIVDPSAFNLSNNVKVYYMPRTTAWPTPPPIPPLFGGRPTVLWNPQVLNDASFGVVANHFGFTITGTSGMIVVVEACTDLITWSPLQTISFTSGSFAFNDPDLVENHAARFYRLRMP